MFEHVFNPRIFSPASDDPLRFKANPESLETKVNIQGICVTINECLFTFLFTCTLSLFSTFDRKKL